MNVQCGSNMDWRIHVGLNTKHTVITLTGVDNP